MNNQTTQKFSSMRESRHLSEYLRVLSKHRWLIISFLVITVALTMLATFLMKPVYEATATLVIDKEQTTSPLTGNVMNTKTTAPSFSPSTPTSS